MTAIALFTDEDVYGGVAPALRRRGIDAISTPEVGRTGSSDDSQLEWATFQQRALITFNVAHFVMIHTDWLQSGRHHAGVIVSEQLPIGELIRRLTRVAASLDREAMRDRLEFLGNWR